MISTNWLHKLALAGLGLGMLLGLALAAPVRGQSDGCPDGANCIDASNFDSGVEGWAAESATADWLSSYTLGLQQANGVLHLYDYRRSAGSDTINNAPGVYKSFYLQPGQYRVIARAGQDATLGNNGVFISARAGGYDVLNFSSTLSAWYYTQLTTQAFTVTYPEQVRVRLLTGANAYFDYVWIEQVSDQIPTATPGGPTDIPGTTRTPTPTYIARINQATPAPPPTAVCQSGSPSTGTIPEASTITGTSLAVLETFDYGSLYRSLGTLSWTKVGEVDIQQGDDHTGGQSSSVSLHYDPHWNQTTATGFSHALTMPAGYGYPVWINAWAQADVVAIGGTAKLEIWEEIGGSWSLASATNISAQQWYPVHAVISDAATSVAFVAVRSDVPSAGYALLDDIYVYAPEANKPYCDGKYPAGTVGIDDTNNVPGTQIFYPADKPCPGGIMQPNNLWGMLLAQTTLFLDTQMAWAPAHVLGQTRDLAQQFMLGPVGGLIMLATIILDWNVPIIMLGVYIAFQTGLGIIGIWKVIRRAFMV